ncbi:MAG: glycosyltransferase family 4 protein [Deltaproteobacteria bacterium]|jgi:glycosyltransferase involved in cell wall biosynthesis|nr:glycosyltransferase family 4 protein [Deltaproteobacteria bacterium]
MLFVLLDLHPQPEPSQQRVLALLRALVQTEPFTPLLICRKNSLLADRAAAEGLPMLALGSSRPLHPVSLLRIWLRLRPHRRVILQSFGEQAAVLANLLAARRRPGRTIVLHTRFFTPGMRRPMLQKSYAAADAIVCGSSTIAKLVQQENELPSDTFRIIPPGTKHSDYSERMAQRNGRVAICMPGALTEGHGQASLVHAMAALWQVEDLPPWEVRLAGTGPMFHFLLDEAQKLGVLDRLAILGEQDMHDVLPHCKLLVLPPGELVYAPALAGGWAVGLPVICPALPAAIELVRDGENALLVAPDNPQALASAMLRIIRDAKLAEKLVQGGRNALASVSEERMIADNFALCRELIASHTWVAGSSVPAQDVGAGQP